MIATKQNDLGIGVVASMKFICLQPVMRRGIKPANILLDDHGFAIWRSGNEGNERIGTPYYTMPRCTLTTPSRIRLLSTRSPLTFYELILDEYIFSSPIARPM
jgi:hypothetical protein